LTALHENYRQVKLIAKTGVVFEAGMRPFNPDYVYAIDFAASEIAHRGKFEGWLPVWKYTLADEPVDVVQGDELFEFDVRKVVAPPPSEIVLRAPEPALPTEPMPKRTKDGNGPNWVRIPLWAAAGVSAGFAGTYYGLGASSHSAWSEATDLDELNDLRFRANTYARWSAIAGGMAVGFGVTGALAGPRRTNGAH